MKPELAVNEVPVWIGRRMVPNMASFLIPGKSVTFLNHFSRDLVPGTNPQEGSGWGLRRPDPLGLPPVGPHEGLSEKGSLLMTVGKGSLAIYEVPV